MLGPYLTSEDISIFHIALYENVPLRSINKITNNSGQCYASLKHLIYSILHIYVYNLTSLYASGVKLPI